MRSIHQLFIILSYTRKLHINISDMVTHFTYCCITSKKKEKKLVAQIHDLHSDVTDSTIVVHKCRDVTTTCYWVCLVGVPVLPSSICSLCLRWNTSIWQTAKAMIISHVGIFVQLHSKNNFDRIQFLNEWVKNISNGYLELECARLFSCQNPASGMQLLQQED